MEEFLINFPNVSPFHGLQLFWNCCTVGPFHGVRCFKKRLLQPGSPMGSQVLAHLLQSGLIFPWSSRSCQEQCGFPMGHSLLRAHPAALMWGPPWVARGQPASPWAIPQAAGESLFLCLEHFFPPPLTLMSSELYIFPLLPAELL